VGGLWRSVGGFGGRLGGCKGGGDRGGIFFSSSSYFLVVFVIFKGKEK
jgi:hypothetical protein